jgi:uroporphyrinogen-III synthase
MRMRSWLNAGATPRQPMPEAGPGDGSAPADKDACAAADTGGCAPATVPASASVSLPLRAVVITRPRRQAEALAAAVAALGRTPVILPLLEIAPAADQAALAGVFAALDRYALVAFVSPNAVDAAFAHIGRWPDGVEIAVVGEGSRAALARHGVDDATARIHCPRDPARSDSEQLIQALDLACLDGRRVLVVRGDGGRELLPDALRAAGCTVDTVAAYRRAVPRLDAALETTLRGLLQGRSDWIVTSSEALRGLADMARELDARCATTVNVAELQRQHLIVPHARIAETARALGFGAVTLTGSGDERLLAALQS